MHILAVDCSGNILSVGVGLSIGMKVGCLTAPKHPYREERGHAPSTGPGFVGVMIDAGFRHAERLMGAVDFCLAEAGLSKADIDLLACTRGPGSFTGLRIALACIKGMAFGLGKPFVTVPTLDMMALGWEGVAPVIVPVMDAKRSRFFFAIYESGRLVSGPHDDTADRILQLCAGYPEVLFVGPDAEMLEGYLQDRSGYRIPETSRWAPIDALVNLAAKHYAEYGSANSAATPLYLRTSDAEESATRKRS